METLPGLPRLGHASTVSVCFSPAVENFLYLKSRQASFDAGGEINFVKKNSAFSFLNSSTSWYVLPFLCFRCSSSCCSCRWWSSSGCWFPCCCGSSCNNWLSCCSPNYIPTGCSCRLLCCFCCLYGF